MCSFKQKYIFFPTCFTPFAFSLHGAISNYESVLQKNIVYDQCHHSCQDSSGNRIYLSTCAPSPGWLAGSAAAEQKYCIYSAEQKYLYLVKKKARQAAMDLEQEKKNWKFEGIFPNSF